jgi:hypothetical protein
MGTTRSHVSFFFILDAFKPAPDPFKFVLDSPVISTNKIVPRDKFTAPLPDAGFSNMGADLFFGHSFLTISITPIMHTIPITNRL